MKTITTKFLSGALRAQSALKTFFLFTLVLCSLYGYSQQTEQSYRSAFGPNALIGYLAYTPPNYSAHPDSSYPLLIFLHGAGEKTWDPQDLSNLYKVKANGPPKLIDQGQQFPFIVISPQCPFSGWDDVTTDNFQTSVSRPGELVDEILEKIKTIYRVDPNRIYITGLSMGGAGAWTYTLRYPQKLAASIPIAGWPDGTDPCSIATNKVAVWAFQGEYDGGASIQGLVDNINSCNPAPNPLAKATVYAGVGHDAWTETYDNTGPGIAPDNIYSWLLRQHKGGSVNHNPVALAGPDQVLTLPNNSIILNGSATDSDGSIASYAWTKISGGAAVLTNASTAALSVSSLTLGTYVFRLTATDNQGATGSDDVTVTVSPGSGDNGDGLSVSYFPAIDLSGTPVTGISATVNNDWGTGSPATGIPTDYFSARWTGEVKPLFTETYTFYTNSDDGIRLWVNNVAVIDNWTDHGPVENSGTISLTAGVKYDIRLEYYEKTGGAVAKLSWSSISQTKQIIPQSQLYSNSTGNGTGLKAEYYNTIDLTGTAVIKTDASVDYDWGNGAPFNGINTDYFSVRWTGSVQPAYSEVYTFYTLSDDGIRLWVNGVQIIDNWSDHAPVEDNGTITLQAGVKYDIRLEYYEKTGGAVSRLYWSSASHVKQIIPQQALFVPAGTARTAGIATFADAPASGISVYPLPADNSTTILYTSDANENVSVKLFDQTTKEVLYKKIAVVQGSNSLPLDLSAIPNGLYLLVVTGSKDTQTTKLVIAE